MQPTIIITLVGVSLLSSLWQPVMSHGRLVEPASRASMWRFGFDTPKNYDDNQLFCGGLQYQVSQNYRCGICGDPYNKTRHHEAGGKYATGTIAKTYTQGQEVTIEVDLTANHKGWFEFKICPTNDYKVKATQECLDTYVLELANEPYVTKFPITTEMGSTKIAVTVELPENLFCDFCVLQWHYHTGNSWGTDPDGTQCLGCGYQEEFYGCADVKIQPRGGQNEKKTTQEGPGQTKTTTVTASTTTKTPTTTTTNPTVTTQPRSTIITAITTSLTPTTEGNQDKGKENKGEDQYFQILSCKPVRRNPGLKKWCDQNCLLNNCPKTHCSCRPVAEPRAKPEANLGPGCYAVTPFSDIAGLDDWCANNCRMGSCHAKQCFCKD